MRLPNGRRSFNGVWGTTQKIKSQWYCSIKISFKAYCAWLNPIGIIATATAEPEVPPTLLPSPFLHGTPPTTGPEKSQPKKIQQKTAAVGRKQQEQAEASRSRQKPSEASKNQQQLPQRQQEQSSQTVQVKENNHLPQSLCDVNWGKNEVQNEVKTRSESWPTATLLHIWDSQFIHQVPKSRWTI